MTSLPEVVQQANGIYIGCTGEEAKNEMKREKDGMKRKKKNIHVTHS